MVRNIMANGVLQPIVIVRDWEAGRNLVVAGRQRVKAAREANKRLRERGEAIILVPAVPRKDTDGKGAGLAGIMVSENEIRRDDNAMVKARKMERLKELGHDADSIALHFGINRLTVENHLCLIGCAKPVQRAVEGGFIGISDVKYLSRLTPSQQTAKVEELIRAIPGKQGHARAKAKREVLTGKSAAPKLKTRAQIDAKLKEVADCGPLDASERKGWREALEWMLGGVSEPEKDTRTRDMVDELAKDPA